MSPYYHYLHVMPREATVQPVLEAMPLIVTEIGENDCSSQYITPLMTWLDSQSTGAFV